MRRSWEKLLFVVVWVLGVSLVVSTSTRLQGAMSFQSRLQQGAARRTQFYSSSSRSRAAIASSFEVGRSVAVPTSDASTPARSLLDLETSTADGPKNHLSKNWVIIIIIVVSITTVVAIAIAIFLLRKYCFRGRKRKSRKSNSMLVWTNQLSSLQHHEFSGSESNSRRGSARLDLAAKGLDAPWLSCKSLGSVATVPCSVSYALLQAATQNFSSSNLLGEGSFGLVYKAEMDCDHGNAAVKRLCGAGSKHCHKEFQGEVDLMSKIRHPNLVALLGYSNDGPEPLVVYELMQNGSLHDQLHGPSCGTALAWHLRLKIALEAARGLEHLHESCKPPIIHRDFKASNILLDASFNAKVSDFGLAVALEEGGFLKEDVQVQGTFGYIAPEYLMDGMLTEKSDVYGFGVVLLELLTGRLPIDSSLPLGSQSLVTWVTPLLKNRAKLMEILDPSLQDSVNEKHLHQVAAVAVLCVQAEPSYRPLIADVVQSLLPLVPQELGGVWRDPKTKPCFDNASSKKLDCEALEVELQSSHSQRSDYSVFSVEHFPKSSILDSSRSLGRTRSWENVTTSYLEQQHCEGQGT